MTTQKTKLEESTLKLRLMGGVFVLLMMGAVTLVVYSMWEIRHTMRLIKNHHLPHSATAVDD